MGWSDCGTDSDGRPIGYGHNGTCDEPGCTAKIHRGLAYACGGEHLETEWSCEGYFCAAHLYFVRTPDRDATQLCRGCADKIEGSEPATRDVEP